MSERCQEIMFVLFLLFLKLKFSLNLKKLKIVWQTVLRHRKPSQISHENAGLCLSLIMSLVYDIIQSS